MEDLRIKYKTARSSPRGTKKIRIFALKGEGKKGPEAAKKEEEA